METRRAETLTVLEFQQLVTNPSIPLKFSLQFRISLVSIFTLEIAGEFKKEEEHLVYGLFAKEKHLC